MYSQIKIYNMNPISIILIINWKEIYLVLSNKIKTLFILLIKFITLNSLKITFFTYYIK